jgi:hypothetical protein
MCFAILFSLFMAPGNWSFNCLTCLASNEINFLIEFTQLRIEPLFMFLLKERKEEIKCMLWECMKSMSDL